MYPYVYWDVSPVRPWEWWSLDAQEWTIAQDVRSAIQAGIADAQDDHQADQDLKREIAKG